MASAWHAMFSKQVQCLGETKSDPTTCWKFAGDVPQAGLQAEQHRPASCLPAQACSRHASDCKCTLCCTSGGEQACWSVPREVSAGSSCSGSGTSGKQTAYCHFQGCICQRSGRVQSLCTRSEATLVWLIGAAQHPAVKSCVNNDLHCMVARSHLVSIV